MISAAAKIDKGCKIKAHVISDEVVPEIIKNALRESVPSIELDFIDAGSPILKKLSTLFIEKSGQIVSASWLRILIPELFPNFDKIIYLDCDIVVGNDLSKLADIPLSGYSIGAVKDPGIEVWRNERASKSERKYYQTRNEYLRKILEIKNPSEYFNSGLLIINAKQLHKDNFFYRSIEWLKTKPKLKYKDQDLLNHFFCDKYKHIDERWNVLMGFKLEQEDTAIQRSEFASYYQSLENPWCYHYAGIFKPWLVKDEEFSLPWTQYVTSSKFSWQLFNASIRWEIDLIEDAIKSSSSFKFSLMSKISLLKVFSSLGIHSNKLSSRKENLKKIFKFIRK